MNSVNGKLLTTSDANYTEDTPHVSGDRGSLILGVRQTDQSPRTDAVGDYSPLAVSSAGAVFVSPLGISGVTDGEIPNKMMNVSNGQAAIANAPLLFNGSTWDRQRGNVEATVFASAARTANTISPEITNHNARGIIVYIDVSAASGSGGLTVRVQGKNVETANFNNLNVAPTPLTAIGSTTYVLYPGASGAGPAQVTALPLPRSFRIRVDHADSTPYTYSVSYALIL